MKKKTEEHIPILSRHGGPATELDGLYEIALAVERNTEAVQDAANALWAIKKYLSPAKDRVEDAGDLGRIYHGGAEGDYEKANIKHRIEAAKKRLLRQGKKS